MWKTFHDVGSYWCNYFPSIPIIFFIQENMIYINFFISYFIILNTLFNILCKVNLKNAIKLYEIRSITKSEFICSNSLGYVFCYTYNWRALRFCYHRQCRCFCLLAHSGSAYSFLDLRSVKTGTLSERRMSELCRLVEQIVETVAGSDQATKR